MTIATPPTITALPPAPDPTTPIAEFDAKAYTWSAALAAHSGQISAVASNVYANALEAEADGIFAEQQALSALSSKNAAETAAVAASAVSGATLWASGSYATGAVVWSPVNGQNYRRKAPGGASPTDPSADPTNWYSLISLQGLALTRITANTTAVAGRHYLIANSLELLLPATHTVNDRIGFTDLSLTKTATINPNGGKIRNTSGVMVLNQLYAEAVLIGTGATEGWI